MKTITSRDNPTFKALKALSSDTRLQREMQRTVLEGVHLIEAALAHGVTPELVAVREDALADREIAALLQRLRGVETLCLSERLFCQLSTLATPPGILARITIPGGPPAPEGAVSSAPSFDVNGDCLLLDAVQDAGNVGALLRCAAAAGVRTVLLGPGCAGAWTPRVLRAAQGAHFALQIGEQIDLAVFLKTYAGQSLATVAHGGEPLYALDLTRPCAWLFGNEGAGLAPALAAAATRRVTIPLAPESESLNVAAAAAVCLFEMRRQREFG